MPTIAGIALATDLPSRIKSIQTGLISISSVSTKSSTIVINSVRIENSMIFCTSPYFTTNYGSAPIYTDFNHLSYYGIFVDSTSIILSKYANASMSYGSNLPYVVPWQVVEFN